MEISEILAELENLKEYYATLYEDKSVSIDEKKCRKTTYDALQGAIDIVETHLPRISPMKSKPGGCFKR